MILFLTATVRTEKQTQSFRSNKFNKMCVKLIRDPFFFQLNEPKSFMFFLLLMRYIAFSRKILQIKGAKGFYKLSRELGKDQWH